MLKHYLTIAFRNLLKHKIFSFINMLGLALGIASSLLIFLFVSHEWSYDRFHAQADRIFRVTYQIKAEDFQLHTAVTPNVVSPLMQREFPEVVSGVRLYKRQATLQYEEQVFPENGIIYADSSFFEIFSFAPEGQVPKNALVAPRSIVLTEPTAKKLFGSQDPIGKSLKVGTSTQPFNITAVIPAIPGNSHIQFDVIASFSSIGASRRESYGSANYYTYLLLNQAEAKAPLEAKIPALIEREVGPENASQVEFALQPLTDVHLRSNEIKSDLPGKGDITYTYIFVGIALLVLVIACINYMNLATARAVDRAREIGIRKVVGALRSQLISQFLGEALMITGLATVLALAMIGVAFPYFKILSQRPLALAQLAEPSFMGIALLALVLIACLAGALPAFSFSSFKPVSILKGAYKNSKTGTVLRKSLVVFQFAISILLITATLVVQQQLSYIQNKKLGYDREVLVRLPLDGKMKEDFQPIKNHLLSGQYIEAVTAATESPIAIQGGYSLNEGIEYKENESKYVTAMSVEKDFVKTVGLELIAGSDYTDASEKSETIHFLLNEKAVELIGWSQEEAIGKRVNLNGRKGQVQGVVKDFHISNLRNPIQPLVLFTESWQLHQWLVRIDPMHVEESLTSLKSNWEKVVLHRPFEYEFLDDEFQSLYLSEQRIGKIFSSFAFLAIVIACLGLFGLAAYTAVQRSKEIGIRKVLGATVAHVLGIFSKEFGYLVGIAFLISAPLGWWAMSEWLSGFSYKIDLSMITLLTAGGGALLIAWLTVGYQALKSAWADPVEALRDE